MQEQFVFLNCFGKCFFLGTHDRGFIVELKVILPLGLKRERTRFATDVVFRVLRQHLGPSFAQFVYGLFSFSDRGDFLFEVCLL